MWFGKKKGAESVNSVGNLNHISNNLANSFERIKNDMSSIRDWLHYFKEKEEEHDSRLKDMESRMEEFGEVLTYMQEARAKIEEPEELIIVDDTIHEGSKNPQLKILDDLTDTQKSIFYRLGTLLYETSQEWITSKALAQEVYPEKSYDKVRSTLSEYASILMESGLIKKKRKGKLTYLSITEKGLYLFEKTKKEKLKKIIIKK